MKFIKLPTILAIPSLFLFLGNAYSSTLAPIQAVQTVFDTELKLVGTAGEQTTITPILEIPPEHQGLKAKLYALALFHNGLWQVKKAHKWSSLDDIDEMPAFDNVTLGELQQFELYSGHLPSIDGGLDIFYAYRIKKDPHFYGNGFRVTISETARQLQELIETKLAEAESQYGIRYGIPGLLMAVNIKDEGYWVGASGVSDLATQKPMQEMTTAQFKAASVTKTFTSMAILQLAEEGMLNLDDTLEQWLPGMVPNGEDMTLRHLLNHTSGIPDFTASLGWLVPLHIDPLKQWTPEELIQLAFAETQSLFPPGEGWYYSSTGYILLGLVIEQVTGETWESEVQQRFIEPLGLRNTVVPLTGEAAIAEEYIHGYINQYEVTGGALGEDKLTRVGPLDPSFTGAAGNMISTVADLSRWATAIASGELLNFAYEEEQFTWFPVNAFGIQVNMGLGIVQDPQYGFVGHRGQLKGYDVTMQYDRDGGGAIVVMMNRSVSSGDVQEFILYDALDILRGE